LWHETGLDGRRREELIQENEKSWLNHEFRFSWWEEEEEEEGEEEEVEEEEIEDEGGFGEEEEGWAEGEAEEVMRDEAAMVRWKEARLTEAGEETGEDLLQERVRGNWWGEEEEGEVEELRGGTEEITTAEEEEGEEGEEEVGFLSFSCIVRPSNMWAKVLWLFLSSKEGESIWEIEEVAEKEEERTVGEVSGKEEAGKEVGCRGRNDHVSLRAIMPERKVSKKER